MKTIKTIDLLIKLVNGEEMPKLKGISDFTFYLYMKLGEISDEKGLVKILNDEVEIIEEDKKIEKLDVALLGQCDNWLQKRDVNIKSDFELNPYIIENIRENTLYFQRKINELIDIVNDLRGDE